MSKQILIVVASWLGIVAAGCMDVPAPTLGPDAQVYDDIGTDAASATDGQPDGPLLVPAALLVDPTLFDFGNIVASGQSGTTSFTLTNTGEQSSGALDTSLTGDAADFDILADACHGNALAGGATCQIALRFSPATTGDRQASLSITATPGGAASATLLGRGLQPGTIALTPASHDFGQLDVSAPALTRTFTAANQGQGHTGLISVSLSGLHASSFEVTSDNCAGTSLAPLQSCSFTVGFAPSTVGVKAGSIVISADPGGSSMASVGGIGTALLTVNRVGGGQGTVTSSPPGINCGATCTAAFETDTVTLEASGAPGSRLTGWTGCDSTSADACSVQMTQARTVTARFDDARGALAVGADHSCALTGSGGLKCWGRNTYGQLGDGTTTNRAAPVSVVGLSSGVAAVSTGAYHTCALTSSGAVRCWGRNTYGQVGDGTTTNRTAPVSVVGLSSGVAAVSTGGYHTCALTGAGGLTCWGYNYKGGLGDGTTTNRTAPVSVTGLSSIAAVSAGGSHTCALTTTGGVECWGDNGSGQVGDNTNATRTTPVAVTGLSSGVAAVSAGGNHSCALTSSGGLTCWGNNDYGRLGDGTTTNRWAPVSVTGLSSGAAVVAAGGSHSCALTTGGGVACWGYNAYGRLGDGTTTQRTTPVSVTGFSSGGASAAAGGAHSCALTSSGGIRCWGHNPYGQLGDGTTTYRTTPVAVVGY